MDDMEVIRAGMGRLRLADMKPLSKQTKIPEPTLIKIYYGITKYPRFPTLRKLAEHFRKAA
jgi:predicted transcriptional regulator